MKEGKKQLHNEVGEKKQLPRKKLRKANPALLKAVKAKSPVMSKTASVRNRVKKKK